MEITTVQSGSDTFEKVCELITQNPLNDIIEAVGRGLGNPAYIKPLPCPGRARDKTDRHYCYVLNDLKENLAHYKWLYHRLNDARSKEVLLNLLRFRLLYNRQFLRNACDKGCEHYFDPGIVHCREDEVFVDCGAYNGDTAESFIRTYKAYKHIYSYEPLAENAAKCAEALGKFENVTVRALGVGKKRSASALTQSGASSSFIIDAANKKQISTVHITSLDEDIEEPVSFIKMDIEGCEIDALIGAKRHIQSEHPKLAISVYHLPSDIWEIPRLIDAINPGYDFYLRHYNEIQSWETVLYAIPKAEDAHPFPDKEQPGVYSLNGYFGYWRNQELGKGCGMVPFLFYKKHGCKAVMVSTAVEPYPYLDTCLKGMTMDYLPDASLKTRCQYIADHHRDMDILMLYGPHPHYYPLVETYRKHRPDGKVYLALDANLAWMDKIRWSDPAFLTFLGRCDVVAERGKKLQKYLSIKWPCKIEYIPNGYYNHTNCDLDVDFSAKENVILTVGRIGTKQKNNELLLEAFSQVADKIPDWSLKLVGRVENAFQSYIDTYFEKHPHLKDRVAFSGLIEDKQKLFCEYKKAKIFILTSICEGQPNVVPEALINGCYMITSGIDAAEDIIDHGRCGTAFPINNLSYLAQTLVNVCSNPQLIEYGAHNAIEYARHVYDFEKIVGRLHYLLFEKE